MSSLQTSVTTAIWFVQGCKNMSDPDNLFAFTLNQLFVTINVSSGLLFIFLLSRIRLSVTNHNLYFWLFVRLYILGFVAVPTTCILQGAIQLPSFITSIAHANHHNTVGSVVGSVIHHTTAFHHVTCLFCTPYTFSLSHNNSNVYSIIGSSNQFVAVGGVNTLAYNSFSVPPSSSNNRS
jgi:hypothetical protein